MFAVLKRVSSYLTVISGPPECAPDLSDPMSVATYAGEEISAAKDGVVRYFSDEEGMKTNRKETCQHFDIHVM